ncbi:MAG: bifunctional phosphoribosyl-AMP cyclohydrolase/phosphoribosyl-ATP diphosphatase HisIE, partial [Bacteroidota bacterium]|nr:bifunctional phosphoribosyl-AMP cyclohydrolase/phosphoribosyl-ATP diphosphatase HisIE [Bacteroidota bacterium]
MEVNFSKYVDGLVPAIIQDDQTGKVLMLGFMNQESLNQSRVLGKVTFYSRAKKRLWTKGEESGHFLMLKDIMLDCDQDSLLIKASPLGPVCHTGADTCFNEKNDGGKFLGILETIIRDRKNRPQENSYVSGLFSQGINKIAQKVGEEAVELI